ncbi:MAG TPA: filament integrity protein FraC [Crinalium sp.]|jgi:hypothetical protein
MPIPVLPLKMIAFQSLLMLVAIAVEAYVLRRELKLLPKQSIDYATTINFLSVAVGWVLFFNFQGIIPDDLRVKLINCIFFDRWQQDILWAIILAAVVTFFVSFFVKFLGLSQLRLFLGDKKSEAKEDQNPKTLKFGASRRAARNNLGGSGEGNAVLKANALSYSAISLILLIRFMLQGSLNVPVQ